MPGYTDPKAIPYPLPSEAPNGAAQMRALADKVDDLLVAEESARVAADTALDGRLDTAEGKITDLETQGSPARVRYGYSSLTVAGTEGEAVLAHNAGWVPSHVLLTPRSSARALALTVDTTGATAANVRVRAFNVDTGAPLAAGNTFGVYWTVRR